MKNIRRLNDAALSRLYSFLIDNNINISLEKAHAKIIINNTINRKATEYSVSFKAQNFVKFVYDTNDLTEYKLMPNDPVFNIMAYQCG